MAIQPYLTPPYVPRRINPVAVFPKIGVPQNGWFIMEKPIEMDDLGGKPTIFGNTQKHAFLKLGIYWVYLSPLLRAPVGG